ncbi:hypothetical protein D805_0138 [Bifidobacterium thermophilum RBL67]|uniref:Uncharacterized protein n=1 Tax=Bifidobacterium thermophilum RBL67 TaxID=1254439 RepID=M4RAD5_9BIFI|nr:hypothetical protein D805_0138 [Bifidobacterium thermophilum RBL67]
MLGGGGIPNADMPWESARNDISKATVSYLEILDDLVTSMKYGGYDKRMENRAQIQMKAVGVVQRGNHLVPSDLFAN